MDLESLPLEQSMTISEVEWNNDSANVIEADEKQFIFNNESQLSQLSNFPDDDDDEEFEDSPALCEQSWGCYFAERSGAMGDILGTNKARPQKNFNFNAHNQSGLSMIQDPSAPFPEICLNPNDSWTFGITPITTTREQFQNDVPFTPTNNVNNNLIAELSPILFNNNNNNLQNIEEENEDDDLSEDIITNLLPEFQNITVDMHNENMMIDEIQTDENKDDESFKSFNDEENERQYKTLSIAIEDARQRRRSLEPKIIIKPKAFLNQNKLVNNIKNVEKKEIVTIQMKQIQKVHRFIHFYINPAKLQYQDLNFVKMQCGQLLQFYVSKFENITISFQTYWYNESMKQCTFYILIESNTDNDGDCAMNDNNKYKSNKKTWCQIFKEALHSYQWIKQEFTFSEMQPLQ